VDDQTRYQDAKRRVEELKGFYLHLISYVLVNTFLIIINLLTSSGYLWFIWPLVGWSIGLVVHAISVYGGWWGKSWEERKIREIMEKGGDDE